MDYERTRVLDAGDEAILFLGRVTGSVCCIKYHYTSSEPVSPEKRARKEFDTLRALDGIRGVPHALYLDANAEGRVESLLVPDSVQWAFKHFGMEQGLALLARSQYRAPLVLEYLIGSQIISAGVQSPEFFDDLRRIATDVNARGYTLPKDLHAKNVLVTPKGPAVIDWTRSNTLEQEPNYRQIQSANITKLEQRFGYD